MVNGRPAAAHYVWDDATGAFRPHAIQVIEPRGERIGRITVFVGPERFARFGLPETLPGT